MALRVRGMPLRTALFATIADRLARTPVWDLDEEGIAQARAALFPRNRLTSALFGPVSSRVGIGVATATARDGHRIPLRTYRPRGRSGGAPLPVVLYFHGGGWVLGNVINYDPICAFLSDGLDALVISVDYRMAPEHRAPTAALDCVDASRWVLDHCPDLGVDAQRMAVCGDSAGGNLAAVVAQVFRDDGLTNITHQCLLYPATDMTMASPSIAEHANGAILTKRSMDAFADHYVPDPAARTEPLVSPLFGELSGLPPALIQTADLDPIRDDGIRYAEALEAAGVTVRLTNYLGVPHGFAFMPGATVIGEQHRAEILIEMGRHLGPRD